MLLHNMKEITLQQLFSWMMCEINKRLMVHVCEKFPQKMEDVKRLITGTSLRGLLYGLSTLKQQMTQVGVNLYQYLTGPSETSVQESIEQFNLFLENVQRMIYELHFIITNMTPPVKCQQFLAVFNRFSLTCLTLIDLTYTGDSNKLIITLCFLEVISAFHATDSLKESALGPNFVAKERLLQDTLDKTINAVSFLQKGGRIVGVCFTMVTGTVEKINDTTSYIADFAITIKNKTIGGIAITYETIKANPGKTAIAVGVVGAVATAGWMYFRTGKVEKK